MPEFGQFMEELYEHNLLEPENCERAFKVDMKYTKEVGKFINKIEPAQQSAAKSTLVFK